MSKSVLIIDDDVDLATTLAETLRELGYDATPFFSGREALERLAAGERPGVILLDLMMPKMNGWKVCDELSAAPGLGEIPVVIMTAASNIKQPMPTHAREVINKPFELETLLRTIDAA
ncbi:chemotaxis protein CheY [Sorangium cellulosum]|uniref:Chemotaxis protein CheY n=1 Tax=Sorangium cellulosum TaxID=56 RepID=A0A4P2QD62_SORCE|nr:response regulator [Sorangium cellulosum]AUX27286.1 chemotaxis protein CheY [Sorangium cellulosum]